MSEVDTFWLEVGQAYLLVAAGHELEVEVQRDGKYALINYDDASTDIWIMVREADTHVVETLPVP